VPCLIRRIAKRQVTNRRLNALADAAVYAWMASGTMETTNRAALRWNCMVLLTLDDSRAGLLNFPAGFQPIARDDLGDVLAADGAGAVWCFAHDMGSWSSRSRAFVSVAAMHEYIADQVDMDVVGAEESLAALQARKQRVEALGAKTDQGLGAKRGDKRRRHQQALEWAARHAELGSARSVPIWFVLGNRDDQNHTSAEQRHGVGKSPLRLTGCARAVFAGDRARITRTKGMQRFAGAAPQAPTAHHSRHCY